MRKFVVFAALMGMVAAPMAPVGAEETGDIWSKNGENGPSFSRATHCAGIFATAINAVEKDSEDYKVTVKIGTAWLIWAQRIAEGRDAEGQMNTEIDAFNQRVGGLDPDGASAELAKEIKACQTIKTMMAGMEPFTSVYNDVITGVPGFNTAVDCATTYSVIAQSVGESDANYDWFNDGVEMWSKYALDQMKGSDKVKIDAVTARATAKGAIYTKVLTDDQDAGIAMLQADRDSCKGREPSLPKYFKNR